MDGDRSKARRRAAALEYVKCKACIANILRDVDDIGGTSGTAPITRLPAELLLHVFLIGVEQA